MASWSTLLQAKQLKSRESTSNSAVHFFLFFTEILPRSNHWFEKEPAGHSFWPGQFFLTCASAGKTVEKAGQNRRGVCYLSALHARVLGGVSTRTDRAPTVATRTPGLDEVVEDALAARFVQSLFFHSRSLLSFFMITMTERSMGFSCRCL